MKSEERTVRFDCCRCNATHEIPVAKMQILSISRDKLQIQCPACRCGVEVPRNSIQ